MSNYSLISEERKEEITKAITKAAADLIWKEVYVNKSVIKADEALDIVKSDVDDLIDDMKRRIRSAQ